MILVLGAPQTESRTLEPAIKPEPTLLGRTVIRVHRRAGVARLCDGSEIPLIEACDRKGHPTRNYRDALLGVAKADDGVAYYIDFRRFAPDPADA